MQCTKFATYAGLIVTLLAAGCAAQQAESTQPKVAILEFRGAKGGELDDAVREMFDGEYRVVGSDKYDRAARELRAKRMKTSHVRKVARELGVDAVIYGKVVRRSKSKYALSLRVRDGKTGKLIKKLKIPMRKKRGLSKKNARKLEKKLMAVMEDVAPAPEKPQRDVAVAKVERKQRKTRRTRRKADRDDDEDVAVARAEPKRRSRRAKPKDDVELEDDFVIVDKMKDGQVIDDEVPPGLQ